MRVMLEYGRFPLPFENKVGLMSDGFLHSMGEITLASDCSRSTCFALEPDPLPLRR